MITLRRYRPGLDEATPSALSWWPDGETAMVVCDCGHPALLIDHEIRYDGIVTPSVACPAPGCQFHDYVELEEWDR